LDKKCPNVMSTSGTLLTQIADICLQHTIKKKKYILSKKNIQIIEI